MDINLDKNILDYIGKYLQNTNKTVAVAESVTSGLLQFSFSQMEYASEFFKGGLTAYTLENKVRHLKVDEDKAEKCDCVSPQIAEEMALNVTRLFNTDLGIAVTGYATSVKESGFKTFAYFAFVYRNEVVLSEKIELSEEIEAAPAQAFYTEHIMESFKNKLGTLQNLK